MFRTCARSAAAAQPSQAHKSAPDALNQSGLNVCNFTSAGIAHRVRNRGQDAAAHLAKPDASGTGLGAPCVEYHGIAILQERPVFARADANRVLAPEAQFQQRARLVGTRTRLRSGAEQITRP